MVTIPACRSEGITLTAFKKMSQHMLHVVYDSQMSTGKEGARDPCSLWRQALLSHLNPMIFKKNSRLCTSRFNLDEIQGSLHSVVAAATQEQNDQPQDEKICMLSAGCSSSPCKTTIDGANNGHDHSSSIKKLALSTPQPVSEPPLSIVERASLTGLCEFRANVDARITVFPGYFSDEEKLLVQTVAQELQMRCQIGEKDVVVCKLLNGLPQRDRVQCLAPPSLSGLSDNTAEDVYVDVHELAQHGKDGFRKAETATSGIGIGHTPEHALGCGETERHGRWYR
ncbi:unnamed protein product [Peronospora effusa]|nr:unnamed protein product [Peronospora effusa]